MEAEHTDALIGQQQYAELGHRIKEYRRLRHLSQEELAGLAGVSVRTIQRLEKGESVGSAYTLRSITTALKLTPEQLIPQSVPVESISAETTHHSLQAVNWSALVGWLLPLANIVGPALVLWRYRHNKAFREKAEKIVSFQILWTLITICLMIALPLLFSALSIFVGSPFPLSILVYFICMGVNLYFIFRIAIALPNASPFLDKLPKLL